MSVVVVVVVARHTNTDFVGFGSNFKAIRKHSLSGWHFLGHNDVACALKQLAHTTCVLARCLRTNTKIKSRTEQTIFARKQRYSEPLKSRVWMILCSYSYYWIVTRAGHQSCDSLCAWLEFNSTKSARNAHTNSENLIQFAYYVAFCLANQFILSVRVPTECILSSKWPELIASANVLFCYFAVFAMFFKVHSLFN